ncbi:MAG TPA: 2-oxo-4-hydroxy-4-carboxy-5-ureidoimidazoline decarboxylase [Pyrinomonadaceae bacterium]|nr:2-oxo-4-hydroxy-4-carboxy-5-ureidoimidazoline decarboxylase [Pyrinomonadaceae bacterium]
MSDELQQLNESLREEAISELLKCCGSEAWAGRMADERPFHDLDSLLRSSDRIWQGLDARDWLEAFGHHPRIGEKRAAQEVSADAQRWSEEEQVGVNASPAEAMRELVAANHEYERRFGFIFIVCATGKSTEEMLALLQERLKNDTDKELQVAAEEQRRITNLRLKKLIG